LVVGASLAPVVSYSTEDADMSRDEPKAFVKGSEITVKIKAALATEHLASLGRIHVDTDSNGVVWRNGSSVNSCSFTDSATTPVRRIS
jgi:hypothetical protein